jgi:hypothetical protein
MSTTTVDPFQETEAQVSGQDPLQEEVSEEPRRVLDSISQYVSEMKVIPLAEKRFCWVGFQQTYHRLGFKTAVIVRRNDAVKSREDQDAYEVLVTETSKDTPPEQVPLDGPMVRIGTMRFKENDKGPYLEGPYPGGWCFLSKSRDSDRYHLRTKLNIKRQERPQPQRAGDDGVPF